MVGYPPPAPGLLGLLVVAVAFLPGTLVLVTSRGATLVAEGLERLLEDRGGRTMFVLAIASAAVIGLAFDGFVACATTAGVCGLLWSADLVRVVPRWDRSFSNWALVAVVSLVLCGGVEFVLWLPPVAARLGTPAEQARMTGRYDGLQQHNYFRFRSPYEDTRRRPGVRRVVALGDSFTEGSYIPSSDSTWPALLEHILNRSSPTEVINMGRGGWATGNEAELLRRIGWQFNPDLVIVQWLDNDFYATRPDFGIVLDRNDLIQLVPTRFRTGFIRYSGLLTLLERILTNAVISVQQRTRERSAAGHPGWQDVERAMREMGDSAAVNCTPILLVLYPYLFPGRWTESNYPEKELHARMAQLGRSSGFEVLDLLPAFAASGRPGESWWGTTYDTHPGGSAQLLAAETIAERLRTSPVFSSESAKKPCPAPPGNGK